MKGKGHICSQFLFILQLSRETYPSLKWKSDAQQLWYSAFRCWPCVVRATWVEKVKHTWGQCLIYLREVWALPGFNCKANAPPITLRGCSKSHWSRSPSFFTGPLWIIYTFLCTSLCAPVRTWLIAKKAFLHGSLPCVCQLWWSAHLPVPVTCGELRSMLPCQIVNPERPCPCPVLQLSKNRREWPSKLKRNVGDTRKFTALLI